MQPDKPCCNPSEHQGHICEFERDQDWEALKCVTANPTVRCENCGSVADSARHVCMPTDIE